LILINFGLDNDFRKSEVICPSGQFVAVSLYILRNATPSSAATPMYLRYPASNVEFSPGLRLMHGDFDRDDCHG
jgi:hypothetical protein